MVNYTCATFDAHVVRRWAVPILKTLALSFLRKIKRRFFVEQLNPNFLDIRPADLRTAARHRALHSDL